MVNTLKYEFVLQNVPPEVHTIHFQLYPFLQATSKIDRFLRESYTSPSITIYYESIAYISFISILRTYIVTSIRNCFKGRRTQISSCIATTHIIYMGCQGRNCSLCSSSFHTQSSYLKGVKRYFSDAVGYHRPTLIRKVVDITDATMKSYTRRYQIKAGHCWRYRKEIEITVEQEAENRL